MGDNIDTSNSKIIIDDEVGSGGSYSLNGHNNQMKLKNADCRKIVIMGHNNVLCGTQEYEQIDKLVVLGHNNAIRGLTIKNLEVLGHNNTFKYLRLLNNPSDSGFHNKFSSVELAEEEEENITYDTSANHQQFDSSSSSSSDEDDDEDEINVHTTNFHFDTNFNGNMQDFVLNIQSQVGNLLNGINLTHDINTNVYEEYDSDSESSEDEEEKYYEDEEQDEEAHISQMERANIINSINSYAYKQKNSEDDENCAVCLSKLETGQQVKALPCEHVFHPR
jgi:hypothetical protein